MLMPRMGILFLPDFFCYSQTDAYDTRPSDFFGFFIHCETVAQGRPSHNGKPNLMFMPNRASFVYAVGIEPNKIASHSAHFLTGVAGYGHRKSSAVLRGRYG